MVVTTRVAVQEAITRDKVTRDHVQRIRFFIVGLVCIAQSATEAESHVEQAIDAATADYPIFPKDGAKVVLFYEIRKKARPAGVTMSRFARERGHIPHTGTESRVRKVRAMLVRPLLF